MIARLHKMFLRRWGWMILLPALIGINLLASWLPLRIDLTADKRYTLSAATKNLVQKIEEPITIDVFLQGEFPAGFRKLGTATRDFLQLLKEANGRNIQYRFISHDELQANNLPYADTLSKMGALPINLTVQKKAGQSTNLLYPYAWIHAGDRHQLVPLFSGSKGRISQEEINNAEVLLEYQFAGTLQKLTSANRSSIAYEIGHGEPTNYKGYDLENVLQADHRFGLLDMRDSLTIPSVVDLLMIVKPTDAFTEDDKIKLDQFLNQSAGAMSEVKTVEVAEQVFLFGNLHLLE